MRALIVDDEPVVREVLREEFEALGGMEVVGEAENGEVVLRKISSVMVTTYGQHAIRVFEASAASWLLS